MGGEGGEVGSEVSTVLFTPGDHFLVLGSLPDTVVESVGEDAISDQV